MMQTFQDSFKSSDVSSPEISRSAEPYNNPDTPSVRDLKDRLQDLFPKDGNDNVPEHEVLPENGSIPGHEVPLEIPMEEPDDGLIILEDGTEIKLPKPDEMPKPIYETSNDKMPVSDVNDMVSTTDQGTSNSDILRDPEADMNAPNSTYEVDGIIYKTDDNGKVYMADGKLAPNDSYELNGSVYTTDEKGRIISCEAKPQRSPENPRDNDAQREAGGDDRKENDQGGHIVSRDLNGDGGGGNLVAMDSRINQSDYKRMENDVKSALDEGKDVTTKTEISYDGDSKRPDKITVTVTADGKDTVYKFDNNLDGSLKNDVPENGKENVQVVLDHTGGEISSIKEEYDEYGNLTKTTVNITYTDEEGSAHRTTVVITNKSGGEN